MAFLIRKGITYSFSNAPFNPRDLTTEWATLLAYPFGGSPFPICNVYRLPSTNEDSGFKGLLYTEAFCPSILEPPISNCVVMGDFNLELKDPPRCLEEANLSEWELVHNMSDITDGESTCAPPHNTDGKTSWRDVSIWRY